MHLMPFKMVNYCLSIWRIRRTNWGKNVVQIIIDDASNYVNAGARLMEKRKKLYLALCDAHYIDLILEDIWKLKSYAYTLAQAKLVVKFIYGHSWVLSLMRTFTKNNKLP